LGYLLRKGSIHEKFASTTCSKLFGTSRFNWSGNIFVVQCLNLAKILALMVDRQNWRFRMDGYRALFSGFAISALPAHFF
jgi:hypothetical protein